MEQCLGIRLTSWRPLCQEQGSLGDWCQLLIVRVCYCSSVWCWCWDEGICWGHDWELEWEEKRSWTSSNGVFVLCLLLYLQMSYSLDLSLLRGSKEPLNSGFSNYRNLNFFSTACMQLGFFSSCWMGYLPFANLPLCSHLIDSKMTLIFPWNNSTTLSWEKERKL